MAETFSPAMERFFEGLRKTPRGWRVETYLGIPQLICHRRKCHNVNPVSAVATLRCGTPYGMASYTPWRETMPELHKTEFDAICDAYSGVKNHNPALRARLLECCGLTEVGT